MKKRTPPTWRMKNRAVAGSGCSFPFVLVCIFGGAPIQIAAQEPSSLEPGVRVRVTALDCGLRERATEFRALRADALVLETTECPLASVTHLDVSRGRKSHVMRGALIGLAAGVMGTVIGCIGENCEWDDDGVPVDVGPPFPFRIGLAGGVVGGIAGYFIKTERWEEVTLERLRVSLTPQRDGGFALGFSIRF